MACKKIPFLQKIGVLPLCYLLGFAISFIKPISNEDIKSIAEVFLILAIPLFLFSSNLSHLTKRAPKMFAAFLISIIAVTLSTIISTFFFRDLPIIKDLAPGLAGVFTGGTLNLSALAIAFNMPANTFVLINTVDAILGALYLLLLFQWGKSLVGNDSEKKAEVPRRNLTLKNFFLSLFFAAIAVGISYGITILISGSLDLRVLFLTLTTLGLLGSFIPSLQKSDASYHLGDYFVLVFCFALSQLVDFSSIGGNSTQIFLYTITVIFFTAIFYAILCKFLKIDKENATISHVASIYGAAFVVVYANYLKKPRLILPGIAIALFGYTIGTFLGILLQDLLVKLYNL